jgi:hypothetical protein
VSRASQSPNPKIQMAHAEILQARERTAAREEWHSAECFLLPLRGVIDKPHKFILVPQPDDVGDHEGVPTCPPDRKPISHDPLVTRSEGAYPPLEVSDEGPWLSATVH